MQFSIFVAALLLGAAQAFAPSALRAPLRSNAGALKMGLTVGDQFPASALSKWGVKGKTSVIYFFGADGAPSCTKEAAAFDSSSLGVPVVGVRNEKGVKGDFASLYPGIKFVVDEGDEVRSEVGIKADLFGALGGRETYVVDSKGTVAMAFNNQFQPEKHVDAAFPVIEELKASKSGGGSGGFDFSKLFGK